MKRLMIKIIRLLECRCTVDFHPPISTGWMWEYKNWPVFDGINYQTAWMSLEVGKRLGSGL